MGVKESKLVQYYPSKLTFVTQGKDIMRFKLERDSANQWFIKFVGRHHLISVDIVEIGNNKINIYGEWSDGYMFNIDIDDVTSTKRDSSEGGTYNSSIKPDSPLKLTGKLSFIDLDECCCCNTVSVKDPFVECNAKYI